MQKSRESFTLGFGRIWFPGLHYCSMHKSQGQWDGEKMFALCFSWRLYFHNGPKSSPKSANSTVPTSIFVLLSRSSAFTHLLKVMLYLFSGELTWFWHIWLSWDCYKWSRNLLITFTRPPLWCLLSGHVDTSLTYWMPRAECLDSTSHVHT